MIKIDFDKYHHLKHDQPILVGVSGGIDSLALFSLLGAAGYQVIVAHYNHSLRPEADEDALYVEQVAKRYGCQFIGGKGAVKSIAAAERLSLEAAARKARYTFLFEQAEAHQAQAVAVGHNADDQVETVLLHILRGSGLAGVAGMQTRSFLPQFSTHIPLIRPLLNFWRTDLEAYCHENGLVPRFDATNADVEYTRNSIRHELLPVLAEYNPQIKTRLLSLSVRARESLSIVDDVVNEQYQKALRDLDRDYRSFDRQAVTTMPATLRSELVRRAVREILPLHDDVDQSAIMRAVDLVDQLERSQRVDLADGLVGMVDGDRFYIVREGAEIRDKRYPQLTSGLVLDLEVPGAVALDPYWVIIAERLSIDEPISIGNPRNEVILDADRLQLPFTVRGRLDGDRFQQLGMTEGRMKIGDFFTNLKIASRLRKNWPLVLSGDQIIWVAGLQIAETVKVTQETRNFIKLRLEPVKNGE